MPAVNKARAQLRIIGGRWRGRRVHFPEQPGLRPTPDRVRETLFNWLAPTIEGSRCLDLFAGSGALAWEALSRGAAEAVLVESDGVIAHGLQTTKQQLEASRATVVNQDALRFLSAPPQLFDVLFLDPPFNSNLLAPACIALTGWIRPGGFIYIETAKGAVPDFPGAWEIVRQKAAGQVAYYLARQQ